MRISTHSYQNKSKKAKEKESPPFTNEYNFKSLKRSPNQNKEITINFNKATALRKRLQFGATTTAIIHTSVSFNSVIVELFST